VNPPQAPTSSEGSCDEDESGSNDEAAEPGNAEAASPASSLDLDSTDDSEGDGP
jgi:hypothetical protein